MKHKGKLAHKHGDKARKDKDARSPSDAAASSKSPGSAESPASIKSPASITSPASVTSPASTTSPGKPRRSVMISPDSPKQAKPGEKKKSIGILLASEDNSDMASPQDKGDDRKKSIRITSPDDKATPDDKQENRKKSIVLQQDRKKSIVIGTPDPASPYPPEDYDSPQRIDVPHEDFKQAAKRRQSFLKRILPAEEETPPELKAITDIIKALPEDGTQLYAAGLIPIALSRSRRLSPDEKSFGMTETTMLTKMGTKGTELRRSKRYDEKLQAAQGRRVDARTLGLVFLVTCVVGVIVTVYLAAFGGRKEVKTHLGCSSQKCHEVKAFVDSFSDPKVKPCDDFYRHVCGHWLRPRATPSSFMYDMARNFSVHFHKVLGNKDIKITGTTDRVLSFISSFYLSCKVYFGTKPEIRDIIKDYFSRLNITVSRWLEPTDPATQLRRLVHLSYAFRLHTLFRISSEASPTSASWTIYRGWSFSQNIMYGGRSGEEGRASRYFLDVLRAIGRRYATAKLVEDIVAMEDKRKQKTTKRPGSATPQTFRDLDCPRFNHTLWIDALKALLKAGSSLNGDTPVYALDFEDVCNDLQNAFDVRQRPTGALYVLALIAATVLRYDFMLAATDNTPTLNDVCYEAARQAFKRVWEHLMSVFLRISSEAVKSVNNYFQFFVRRVFQQESWMEEGDHSRADREVQKYTVVTATLPDLDEEQIRCTRYKARVLSDTDFTLNRITMYRLGSEVRCTAKRNKTWAKELRGTNMVVDNSSRVVVIPPMFAVPPSFYDRLTESFVNYGVIFPVLGHRLMPFVYAAGWGEKTEQNFQKMWACYGHHSATLHPPLERKQLEQAFGVIQAFRVAYTAKKLFDPSVTGTDKQRLSASNALFIKRSCLTLCVGKGAPADLNTLDDVAAHAACLLAASSLPEFFEAFNCSGYDTMHSLSKCSLF